MQESLAFPPRATCSCHNNNSMRKIRQNVYKNIFAHNLLTNRNSVFEAIELKQKTRKKMKICRKSSALLLLLLIRLQAMCDMFWLLFWLVFFDVVLASAC